MQKYASNLLNYPFTVSVQRSHKKGQSDKKRLLCEDIFTFDIETTSFFYDIDRKPFLYKPGEDPDYWTGVYAGGLPYIWQFGINDTYYYGRDINSFYALLAEFPEDLHIRIAVHNLSFEWHFLDQLTWSNLFAKSSHKPIKASCAEFPNIEFYCTYSLENRSLASWGKALGMPKLTGYLDYNKELRTPYTPLDDNEMAYSERDLKVMYVGITDELKIYKSVWKLPLTSTGKVRRVVRDLLMQEESYVKYIKNLIPETPYDYQTSMYVFAGGYTHANRTFVDRTVYNEDGRHGGHYDFTSSYPYEMVASKFPCSRWVYTDKVLPDPATFEDTAYKMHVVFYNIRCETQNTYIPYSKTDSIDAVLDNGRIISAKQVDTWICESDLEIITMMYTWEKVDVLTVYKARKDYLPIKFVEFILQLFHDKTMLSGAERVLSKARLNGLFGMACTGLLQGEVTYDPDTEEWHVGRVTKEKIDEHLTALRRWRDHRYFLNYDWGVWTANLSRARLMKLIIKYDKHVIYADTDSIFTDIAIDFTEYNNEVNKHLEEVCKIRGLDVQKTRPKNTDGVQAFLGNLTIEPEWSQMRTLGAKRYVERWKEDGALHLTCAGINKEAVTCLHDDIENFKNGVVFDKDEKDVTKLLHTYFENAPEIVFPDGYVCKQKRGVNLRPNGYKLTMDDSYADIVKDISRNMHVEDYDNHLKSVWYDDVEEIIENAWKGVLK